MRMWGFSTGTTPIFHQRNDCLHQLQPNHLEPHQFVPQEQLSAATAAMVTQGNIEAEAEAERKRQEKEAKKLKAEEEVEQQGRPYRGRFTVCCLQHLCNICNI